MAISVELPVRVVWREGDEKIPAVWVSTRLYVYWNGFHQGMVFINV